ncbi:MAG: pseudouridine synthase, partial [Anaerolineae bacterium]
MEERLQKIMAHAGVASRRACEEIIVDGRVKVNGKVVTELGTRVDPDKDTVLLDGHPLTGSEALRYIVLYKPAGYLSDTESTDGRPCLVDLVKVPQRLYPVGRLDFDSEGLMLLTNDGNLAHRLTHPRYEHPKEYLVLVEGKPGPIALRKLRQGIELSGGKTAPAEAEIVDGPPPYLARSSDARSQPTSWLRMVLREGRKREIRHMTAVVGHPVLRLIRVGLGPLRLVHLEAGAWRDATLTELRHLRRVLQDKPAAHGTHLAVVPGRSQRSGPRRAQPAPRPAHGRPPRRPAPDRTDLSADAADAPRRDASADAARPPRHTEGAEAADAPRRDASARPGRRADAT